MVEKVAPNIVKHWKYIPFADALWSIAQMDLCCISTHHVQNTLQCITRMHWGHIMIALNSRCINVYYITFGLDFHALGLARGDLKYPPFLFALIFFTKTNSAGLGALSWPLFWSAKVNRTTDLGAFQPADTGAIPIHINASQMQCNSKQCCLEQMHHHAFWCSANAFCLKCILMSWKWG